MDIEEIKAALKEVRRLKEQKKAKVQESEERKKHKILSKKSDKRRGANNKKQCILVDAVGGNNLIFKTCQEAAKHIEISQANITLITSRNRAIVNGTRRIKRQKIKCQYISGLRLVRGFAPFLIADYMSNEYLIKIMLNEKSIEQAATNQ